MKKPSWILNWVQASETVTDLYLYDYIAHKKSYNWLTGKTGEEITAQDIVTGLADVATPEIVVHINSGGGDAAEGVAIAQAIKDERSRGRHISCQIDGICASAAVNVALACSPVRIPRNAYMMIHDPACNQDGLFTARELRKGADQLDVVKRGIVSGYAERTGLSDREIARMMAAETWMTGEEAVASHFADELLESPVTIQRDAATHNLLLNGCMVNSVAFEDMPEPLKAAQDTKISKGGTVMEIKNLEDLKTAYDIDFGLTNKGTATVLWDAQSSTADPLADLQGWVNQCIQNGYRTPDICIMSQNAYDAFRDRMIALGYLDQWHMNVMEMAPQVHTDGVYWAGRLRQPNLDIYVYTNWYLDDWTDPDTPTEKQVIPTGKILIGSRNMRSTMFYGVLSYADRMTSSWVSPMVPRGADSWVEKDPDVRFLRMQSRPLPVPQEIDSWYAATVASTT